MHKKVMSFVLFTALVLSIGYLQSGNPSQAASKSPAHFEKMLKGYHVILDGQSAPLTTEEETFTLRLHPMQGTQPASKAPRVTVEMSMGKMPMKAPTTVKIIKVGEFSVTTEFTMAGLWTIKVTPAGSAETATFQVSVQ